jgi:hypothetical protein
MITTTIIHQIALIPMITGITIQSLTKTRLFNAMEMGIAHIKQVLTQPNLNV